MLGAIALGQCRLRRAATILLTVALKNCILRFCCKSDFHILSIFIEAPNTRAFLTLKEVMFTTLNIGSKIPEIINIFKGIVAGSPNFTIIVEHHELCLICMMCWPTVLQMILFGLEAFGQLEESWKLGKCQLQNLRH